MTDGCTIRAEHEEDAAAIRTVHAAGFPTDAEARLVDALRAAGRFRVALVAEIDRAVVGHILFTPGQIVRSGDPQLAGLALAPLAVHPAHQRRGIGSALVRAGLDACRATGAGFVFLLGHPEFYRRFGFVPAREFGITNDYTPDDAFMIVELGADGIPSRGGHAQYAPEFAMLG
jgi:putative acetyltransferase